MFRTVSFAVFLTSVTWSFNLTNRANLGNFSGTRGSFFDIASAECTTCFAGRFVF